VFSRGPEFLAHGNRSKKKAMKCV